MNNKRLVKKRIDIISSIILVGTVISIFIYSSFPTSMTFVDNNTIMALEKDGNVRLISNGVLQKEPILKVEVDSEAERGLLGIATLRKNSDKIDTSLTYDHKV